MSRSRLVVQVRQRGDVCIVCVDRVVYDVAVSSVRLWSDVFSTPLRPRDVYIGGSELNAFSESGPKASVYV